MSLRQIFVTTALPYANGNFHIGHIMEYIQADIWVRYQRMQGNAVNFVGADDTHGAPIMIAAEKAGVTPEQFVANIAAGRKQYLDGFHISFDNWHSTDGVENHELAQDIYRGLRDNGLIEVKSRRQKYQIQTLIEHTLNGTIPADYMLQVQTGLLVTGRDWLDFISYSGGLPMTTIRVYPDVRIQSAIIEAAGAFEARLAEKLGAFREASKAESGRRVIPTERRVVQEMFV